MKLSDLQNLIIQIPWHPIYTICQGILVGISLHQNITKGFALALVCGFIHLLFKNISYQKALFIFSLSLFGGSYRMQHIERIFYQTIAASQRTALAIQGKLLETADISDTHTRYKLLIYSAKENKRRIPMNSWQTTITAPKTSDVGVGDIVSWERVYLTINTSNQEYIAFLINNGLIGHIRTKQPPTLIMRPWFSARRAISNLQAKIIKAIRAYTTPETAALVETIFLGKKQAANSPIRRYRKSFQTWGISHYLARSGLHVSLLALLINFLALFCIPWFAARTWLLLILSALYTLISWSSISFIRALTFLILISIGTLQRTPPHSFVVFAWIATATMILQPHQLFALDFQLSFLLSGMLIWRNQIKFFQSLAKPNSQKIA